MIGATVLVYVLFAVLSYFVYENAQSLFRDVLFGKSLLVLLCIGLEASTMCLLFLQWSFFRYEVSETELSQSSGILRRRRHVHSLKNTQSVDVHQTPLGTLLNYGTVTFHNPLVKEAVTLKSIPDVERYAKTFRSVLLHQASEEKIVPQKHS